MGGYWLVSEGMDGYSIREVVIRGLFETDFCFFLGFALIAGRFSLRLLLLRVFLSWLRCSRKQKEECMTKEVKRKGLFALVQFGAVRVGGGRRYRGGGSTHSCTRALKLILESPCVCARVYKFEESLSLLQLRDRATCYVYGRRLAGVLLYNRVFASPFLSHQLHTSCKLP